jgi:hypothetical protein
MLIIASVTHCLKIHRITSISYRASLRVERLDRENRLTADTAAQQPQKRRTDFRAGTSGLRFRKEKKAYRPSL